MGSHENASVDTLQAYELSGSEWVEFTLGCKHTVYSKITIVVEPHLEHYVFCPACRKSNKKSDYPLRQPTCWQLIYEAKVVSDATVQHVLDGTKFIVSRDIMRRDLRPNGGRRVDRPFPYVAEHNDD